MPHKATSLTFSLKRFTLWSLSVGLILSCSLPSLTHAKTLSPRDVVLRWTRVYGKDMAQAASLTTGQFRKGKTPQAWAEERQRLLTQLDYQHLGGMITKETITGNTASVVLKSRIHTKLGIIQQTETYALQLTGGQWLIDRLVVSDEGTPGEKLSS